MILPLKKAVITVNKQGWRKGKETYHKKNVEEKKVLEDYNFV